MSKPYSSDLRKRVAASALAGGSIRAVGALFGVSAATVSRWSRLWRATGAAEPGKIGGHLKPILDEHRGWLLERIAAEAEVTLRELRAQLAERGVVISYGTVWNFVHREGLSFKKKRSAQRAGQAGRRPLPRPLEEVSSQA